MSKKGNGFVKKTKRWYPGLEEYNFVFMETKRKECFKKERLVRSTEVVERAGTKDLKCFLLCVVSQFQGGGGMSAIVSHSK